HGKAFGRIAAHGVGDILDGLGVEAEVAFLKGNGRVVWGHGAKLPDPQGITDRSAGSATSVPSKVGRAGGLNSRSDHPELRRRGARILLESRVKAGLGVEP